tara:strand:- start:1555 stop:2136 length:582 start_codon:yes stop_codon:yes gene_type:complete
MNDKDSTDVYNIMIKIYERDDIPFLDTKGRVGNTGYIDYINVDELTHPIMKSYDIYNRRIIVMQFIIEDTIRIQTFFERYHNCEAVWSGAGRMGGVHIGGCNHFSLLDTFGGLTRHQAKLLLDVSLGNIVKIDADHYMEHKKFIGKHVMLYDKKKIDAVRKIQRYWDICRYNPMYRIARKFAIEGYNEYIKSF